VKLHRQLILLVLAALLPLVALSAALGAAALQQSQQSMRLDAHERVAVIAAAVGRNLDAETDVIETVSNSSLFDGKLDPARFDDMAKRVLHQEPLWVALTLTSQNGERLAAYPHLPAAPRVRAADEMSRAQAVRTGSPVIGPVMLGLRGRPVFSIYVPVIRRGEVVGVLKAVEQPGDLREILLESGLPRNWRAALLDQYQRVVVRSMSTPDVTARLASPEVREAVARGPEGLFHTPGPDGVPLVTAFRVLPDVGWSVHVSIPEGLYNAPLIRSLWLVGAGGAMSLLMAGLFVWLLLRELRLRHSQQAALDESLRLEALGRMTGGVAHDFNNILMIVQGSAELIRRRVAGQERLIAWVDSILSAVQRGQSLTRQLLAFGRRETHEPIGFSLQERAPGLITLLQRSVSRDVAAELVIPESTWPIYADPNALEVALINLAVNASDAMPGGGSLAITAANVVLPRGKDDDTGLVGDYVALSVADTGAGISEEHLIHVFEPFYTTKPAGKGTGLGLSQVYGFARQSNGAVTIRSKPGDGTSVTLYLPRSGEPTAPSERQVQAAAADGDGPALLVEDNDSVAEVAAEMLSACGYAVRRVVSAEAALETLEGDLALVLSDISLVGAMSGIDLAEALAARRPGLPVVLMTGYSEALARGLARNFTVLAKPFSHADLASAVRRARAGPSFREAATA
jgi:signal transduction histidine kinase/CheY-like chemotaxis protein